MPAKFYNENAEALAQQYLSTSFDQVHQSWHQLLPAIMVNPQKMRLNLFRSKSMGVRFFIHEPSAVEPSASLANNHKRFFAVANIALPGLNSDNSSVDDLFEALVMQRGRLKEM
ncbi:MULTISPECIES: hypothetical protein [Colwellia]|uniref:Uncharacterized protein n=1 Tax=Colwellia marinimaniae TaxID=1513592 RepID=A0ABQ0MXK5_9GAMM|nr:MULTISPECIES: hypothetical protein [Colwellia]GAW97075.1 hypothetical protein MTCD1_02701 [Colwellia marinimaniae]